jgi:hypothetical protein
MKIGYATVDWSKGMTDENGYPYIGGSGHYRCWLPAQHLAGLGVDAVVGVLVVHNKTDQIGVQCWDASVHWDCDVVVLQRYMHDGLDETIRRNVADGRVIVNDVDDHFDALDKRNFAYGSVRRDESQASLAAYRRNIAASSAVTVSTPFLADYYRDVNPVTFLLENAVDPAQFRDSWHDRHSPPVVGWVGAIPWRSGDVETLAKWLPSAMSRHAGRFTVRHDGHVPGWTTFAAAAGLDADQVDVGPMRPTSELGRLYENIDVGLVPLNDVPFNHAKSWIKGLEYVASGIPFVAQDLPEYRRLVEEHGIGRIASGRGQWQRLIRAFTNPDDVAFWQSERDANWARLLASPLVWPRKAIDWKAVYDGLVA